jgi:hypothetical protein
MDIRETQKVREMNSTKGKIFDGTIHPLTIKVPSVIISFVIAFLGDLMSKQFALKEELELEMAKILKDFIASNAHLFSNAILDAVNVLAEEIRKAEEECLI